MKTIDEVITRAAISAAPVFAINGWTWASTDPRTPTVDEIKECFYRLYRSVGSKPYEYNSTGRLKVEREEGGGVEFYVEVGSFYPESD